MAKRRKKDADEPRPSTGTPVAQPDRERVAMRAYQIYLERGGGDGQSMEDWLIAERELLLSPADSPDRSGES